MPKVICAAGECKWNDVNNQCRAKEINLSDSYIMTLYEGKQHFNKCRNYEMSEESKRIMNELKELFFGGRTDSGEGTKEPLNGQWITDDLSGIISCSRCGYDAPMETTGGGQYKSKFCPTCGAKMEEREE